MSVQCRELLTKSQFQRAGFALLALCAGVNFGCGSSQDNLFGGSHKSGGAGGLAGANSFGGDVGRGGSSGGASQSTGGSTPATGGSGTATGGSSGADPGGAGGAGDAGSSGLGGAGAAGGSVATGGASGGVSGGAGAGGGPGTKPVLLSGSQAIAPFEGLHCESVTFPTAFTVPGADVLVQATAVHPGATFTHGALAVWVSSATVTGFEVCMTEDADLNGSHLESRLDWVAYTMPAVSSLGVAAGRVALAADSGRSCQTVNFASAFAAAPQVQITPNHRGAASVANDPPVAWVEELTASSFQLCVEELEGADGELEGTSVDWLAYPATFVGAGFSAGQRNIGAFEKEQCVSIATGCANCENVQLSVNHRRRMEDAADSHDAVLVWAEEMTLAGMLTACVRQTSAYNEGHDAHLSIDWLVRTKND